MQVSGTPVDAAPVGTPGRLRHRQEVLGVVFEQSLVMPSTTLSSVVPSPPHLPGRLSLSPPLHERVEPDSPLCFLISKDLSCLWL